LLFYVFFSTYVVLGIAAGFLGVTQASMIADVSDDLELISARRQEGILFGYLNFAGKTASGFGHALAGVCLDFIAFPTDAAPGDVPASTLAELGLLYGPGIGVVGLISFYFFSKYNISRKRHAEIQVELGRH
jgi:GPH family glycoside/pentoside/hexuronide:cation symporter